MGKYKGKMGSLALARQIVLGKNSLVFKLAMICLYIELMSHLVHEGGFGSVGLGVMKY